MHANVASYAAHLANRKAKSVHVHRGANPYKLVACDLDGTLLNSEHSVSDFTRTVLSQLLARGVHLIFATGRPFTDVYRIKRRLDIFAAAKVIATPGVQVVTPTTQTPVARIGPDSVGDASSSSSSPTYGTMVTGDLPYRPERIVPRCFAVTSNGACIYDEANERIYERAMDPRVVRELYNMFVDDPQVNVNVFRVVDAAERQKQGYTNPSDQPDDQASEEWICRYPSDLEAALYKESKFVFRVVPDIEKTYPVDHVSEVFFLCYDPPRCARAEAEIVEHMKEFVEKIGAPEAAVRVAPSTTYCLDVVPVNVSKASALEQVIKDLHLTWQDVIAFGDGLNDVELLSSVGKGCIMGNASPRLKAKLPDLEVIGINDEDGVACKLCEVFGLDAEKGT
ncbi:haloacid dehalogenase-like hydrolase-like protein [Leptomonas pyrrhocoris]|uniref:Haloacid dehalogenase-like hydrolase-like protein n=1 Tax=Leptomonas pyrrhocoris TaxID=157538 RepID=A0A0M9G980_LEPPY|nr:haloacid dehalogenase-like hydrolase-like protein [Leptomonas pyrrhocoris]XP_015663793.1 haloacid dehalogenase-like hydrolase-like protein [Leptomonas pyrrhocoris]KPA85353.1 haloacid dehalogenase-like hydrolase-like protein [Leptomonas pyrrhocoris]KPA85354.1 haloacid dehalogenase-like hydrolase-like protein [Leptomonas pyrrhocoris]|eukprot:XP_015663792.1 haloacid dehalogenase-like hydrolase-like protein [Leptomonas pyrrhocoris]